MQPSTVDASTATESQRELPTAVQLHILSLLPSNDIALHGRVASKAAAAGLSEPQHCTASLSQPLPPHAVPWAVKAGQQHVRQLPFRLKPHLLCTAAVSGSKLNLEIALEILQPSIFPERQFKAACNCPDPGVAAVGAGQPQLLGWLAHRCPELLTDNGALRAAAQHCDLAGLQAAWEAVRHLAIVDKFGDIITADRRVLMGAAGSATGDAVAKMEWLLSTADYSLQECTAEAATRSGDLGRLQWLRQQGCPMGQGVLRSALRYADLDVADWLVDEAGCGLPAAGVHWDSDWSTFFQAAAMNVDAFVKFRWLQERGGPPLQTADEAALSDLVLAAADAGQAEVLRQLLPLMPSRRDGPVQTEEYAYGNAAAASGSIPTAEILLQAGARFIHIAYHVAYHPNRGHEEGMAMIRWLARKAGLRIKSVGALFNLMQAWAGRMAGSTAGQAGMLEGVQLAVGEGPHRFMNPLDPDRTVYWINQVTQLGSLGLAQFVMSALGFEPGQSTLEAAAQGGCEALLEWLVEQYPGCMEGASPYLPAACNGDRGTLTALRRLGVPWGPRDTVAEVVLNGCRAVLVLRWLVEQGALVGSEQEMEEALTYNKYDGEVQSWLRGLACAGEVPVGEKV